MGVSSHHIIAWSVLAAGTFGIHQGFVGVAHAEVATSTISIQSVPVVNHNIALHAFVAESTTVKSASGGFNPFQAVSHFVGSIVHKVGDAVGSVVKTVNSVVKPLVKGVTQLSSGVATLGVGALKVASGVGALADSALAFGKATSEVVNNAVSTVGAVLHTAYEVASIPVKLAEFAIHTVFGIGSGIVDTVFGIGSGIVHTVSDIGSGIVHTVSDIGSGIAHTVFDIAHVGYEGLGHLLGLLPDTTPSAPVTNTVIPAVNAVVVPPKVSLLS